MSLKADCENRIKIDHSTYQTIHDGILALLENRDEVPTHLFFESLHGQFVRDLGENVGWYIYQVKLDMEVKGLVKTEHLKRKRSTLTFIRMVRKTVERQTKLANRINFLHDAKITGKT